jgi:hypothetical protein
LGHKRTYAVQKAMSALPAKADIASYFLGVIGVIGVEAAACASIARLAASFIC